VVNFVSAAVLGHGGHARAPDHDDAHHDHPHREHEHHGHDHHGHDHHGHDHHGHEHHGHAHGQHDMNLRSAYVHVLADAFTSILAITALAAGLWLGWTWLDPVMGIVGAGVILWWSKSLIRDSARVLLDREM